MLSQKPDTCKPCPMYGKGTGFVRDNIVEGSEIVFLYQNPGENETKGLRVISGSGRNVVTEKVEPQPLIGATGRAWVEQYLPHTGFERSEVSICNVLKCRYEVNGKPTNVLPKEPIYSEAVKHCTETYLRIPESTRLVVAGGAHAWRYVAGDDARTITDWRGYLAPTEGELRTTNGTTKRVPIFGTLHIADLFHEPRMRTPTKTDYKRIGAYLRGEWPAPIPDRHIGVDDGGVEYACSLLLEPVARRATVYLDTEYTYKDDYDFVPGSGKMYLFGLGWRTVDGSFTGIQVDLSSKWITKGAIQRLILAYNDVIQHCRVVIQNAAADLPILESNWGIDREVYKRVDDLLLAHAALWCELPHTLDFIDSMLGDGPKLKYLQHTDPILYHWGDIWSLAVAWEKLEPALKRDKGSWWVYENEFLPLVNLHTRATETGIRVNKEALVPLLQSYMEKITEATRLARSYAGYPINLGSSPQVGQYVYAVMGLKERRGKKTKTRTINDDAIAELRKEIGTPFDPEEEERNGLTIEEALRHCAEGGNPILEARVIYAKSGQVVNHYLAPLVRGLKETDE